MSGYRGLSALSDHSLRELQNLLRGPWSSGWAQTYGNQVFGSARCQDILQVCQQMEADGFNRLQMDHLIETLVEDRVSREEGVQLVVTGPPSRTLPLRDTGVVFRAILAQAQQEVILVSYAIYNGKELFGVIRQKMIENPSLRVVFILNIERRDGNTSLESEIVRKFARDFVQRHWGVAPYPELYYDPRSLSSSDKKAVIHAKCVLVDGRTALVSSANFTNAAQEKNIEAGVLLDNARQVGGLQDYFHDLISLGQLAKVELGKT